MMFSRQLAERRDPNNFAKKLLWLWDHKKIPDLIDVVVLHDHYCEFLDHRGPCKCDPHLIDRKTGKRIDEKG